MSKFDAAPPNTHAGGNDDALRTHGTLPMNNAPAADDERVDMEAYRQTVPLWKRFYQHSLTQMLLLSMQAFCGPAMADAIAGKYTTAIESIGSRPLEFVTNPLKVSAVVDWQLLRHPT